MHATKISVRTWVMVMFEMCCSKNGVAAREIERKYGLCPRTAWHLLHRIREAMSHDDFTLFSGDVVATRRTSVASLATAMSLVLGVATPKRPLSSL